jgi:transposase
VQFGIDTHKATLAIAAVDALGRPLAEAEFDNDPAGHRALHGWAAALADERCFAIEGAGAYGYPLSVQLLQRGEAVLEVPAQLTERQRRHARQRGKSDPADAIAIARVALREPDLPRLEASWADRDLKLLLERYRERRQQRTRETSRLHAELARVRPGAVRGRRVLSSAAQLDRVGRVLRTDPSLAAHLLRSRLADLRRLDRELKQLRQALVDAVAATHTTLLALRGIGPILAALILVEARSLNRNASRDQFAAYNGTAPIPASSGQTRRQRLNRGGNRRLNYAIHQMALTQAAHDPRARAYLARRQAEGKTWHEAMRCLKRHLSDVIYNALRTDQRLRTPLT